MQHWGKNQAVIQTTDTQSITLHLQSADVWPERAPFRLLKVDLLPVPGTPGPYSAHSPKDKEYFTQHM